MESIFKDESVGTLFIPKEGKMSGRKRWIAHFIKPHGALVLDEGAVVAVRDKGKSLLAPGILEIKGTFCAGDTVRLMDQKDHEIARGLINYTHEDLKKVLGKTKNERTKTPEVIHRNNLVVL
jgi:glutamate 5-kinase